MRRIVIFEKLTLINKNKLIEAFKKHLYGLKKHSDFAHIFIDDNLVSMQITQIHGCYSFILDNNSLQFCDESLNKALYEFPITKNEHIKLKNMALKTRENYSLKVGNSILNNLIDSQ